jgi:hypothetical protein
MKWYQIFSDGTVIYDDDLKQDTIYPDGCSIEIPTKSLRWFKNNKLHRDGGPAAVYTDGTKHWFQNGKHHRIDGPAIERANGDKFWYQNGKHHRIDGPACEYANGGKYWYIEGIKYTKEGHQIVVDSMTKENENENT